MARGLVVELEDVEGHNGLCPIYAHTAMLREPGGDTTEVRFVTTSKNTAINLAQAEASGLLLEIAQGIIRSSHTKPDEHPCRTRMLYVEFDIGPGRRHQNTLLASIICQRRGNLVLVHLS